MAGVLAVLVVLVLLVGALLVLVARDATGRYRPGGRDVARPEGSVPARSAEDADRRERRIADRESRVDAELHRLSGEAERLTDESRRHRELEATLARGELDLAVARAELEDAHEQVRAERERVAGLTEQAAREELILAIESQARRDALARAREIEQEATRDATATARHIVSQAVQRVASEQTAESVVTVLALPSEDMKGRIIGKEGRNIRAFEAVTGVSIVIDDTPATVLLSCFDPTRREIGRLTLERLVTDGRIHPHQIEEQYRRACSDVDASAARTAADALVAVGITDVHPELVRLLGALSFRTSFGQNVLKHLVESAHLARLMAAEIGADVELCARCAFLHDIGKALTHEVPGSHAQVGADVARRYGERPEVVHAIAAHHDEIEPLTIEAVLTQAADACSGGRPGARREAPETYVTRVRRIEEIASAHAGVEKVFAMQAGREVRVMVSPGEIDDIGAAIIARDIAKQIETELTYPGQVRVTVIRESRAIEIAT